MEWISWHLSGIPISVNENIILALKLLELLYQMPVNPKGQQKNN